MARRLDRFNSTGIFKSKLPQQAWVLFGLSTVEPITAESLAHDINPREFRRLSRVFWDHMLLDRMASLSDLPDVAPTSTIPLSKDEVFQYRKANHTREVG